MIKSREELIIAFKKMHGGVYGYDKVELVKNLEKVEIACKVHGYFHQTRQSHLLGRGCTRCAKTMSVGDRIIKFRKTHGDKYDYSLVDKASPGDTVTIICDVHGEFTKSCQSHSTGSGCRKCSISVAQATKGKDTFIAKCVKSHGDRYDYSLVKYINAYTKVRIICKDHGEFEQLPFNHVRKRGCRKCSNILSKPEVVAACAKVHDSKYSYDNSIYIKGDIEFLVTCPEHGDFSITPNKHKQGIGCQKEGCYVRKIGGRGRKLLSTKEFISAIKDMYSDLDYSKVDYKGATKPVSIICKKHGEFQKTPTTLKQGSGCPACIKGKDK